MRVINSLGILLIVSIMPAITTFSQEQPARHTKDSIRREQLLKEVQVNANIRKLKNDTLSGSLKLDIPLLDLSQNITSVSASMLKEQGVFTLKEAARNSSGTYFGLNNDVFDGASNLYMRGLPQNGIFRNGLPVGNYGHSQDDEAVIDRIEFIRGPAGFLNASGEAGGRINVVTKTPGQSNILNASLAAGSYDFYRAAIDMGAAVREKGFSYRFNAAYNNQHYFARIMKSNKIVIAPVLQYNFSRKTYLLAEYILNNMQSKNGSTFTKYFPENEMLTDDRRANYQADPGLPVSTSYDQFARLVFRHAFNDKWKITSQSSWKKGPSDVWSFLSADTYNAVGFGPDGKTNRLSFRQYNRNKVWSTQLFVNGTFNTGKQITHHFMAGGEYFETDDSTYQSYGTKAFPFDRYQLQYGLNRDSLQVQEVFNQFVYHNQWSAVYGYHTVNIGTHWIITAGLRYTSNKRESRSLYAPETSILKQEAFTPRMGLTYKIDPRTAVYVLYDQSFLPQSGQDRDGNDFKPVRGEDLEAGIKRNWFNNALSTTVTAFRIHRNNMVLTDPANTRYKIQVGQVRSEGIELDMIGTIARSIALSANYAYADVKITKDAKAERVGKRYASAPQQVINTWFRYSFPSGVLTGWSIGLGQSSMIKRSTTTENTTLPDYTKLDGTIAYTNNKITARLLLDNLTNKRYIAAGDIYGGHGYYTEGVPFNWKVVIGLTL